MYCKAKSGFAMCGVRFFYIIALGTDYRAMFPRIIFAKWRIISPAQAIAPVGDL